MKQSIELVAKDSSGWRRDSNKAASRSPPGKNDGQSKEVPARPADQSMSKEKNMATTNQPSPIPPVMAPEWEFIPTGKPRRDMNIELNSWLRHEADLSSISAFGEKHPDMLREMREAFVFVAEYESLSRLEQAKHQGTKELADEILENGLEAARAFAKEHKRKRREELEKAEKALVEGRRIYAEKIYPLLQEVFTAADEIEKLSPRNTEFVLGHQMTHALRDLEKKTWPLSSPKKETK